MQTKQTCFISYNRNDNNIETIRALISYLEEYSKGGIDFLIDEDLRIGKDLNMFMDFINSVDSIILLLTPEYKKKADERITSGVLKEYRIIMKRLEKDIENKKSDLEYLQSKSTFSFIPIIFSRNHEESCPKSLKSYKSLDFSDFYVRDNGKIIKELESKYNKYFQKISSEILSIESINKPSVKKDYRELLQKLFFETKHDNLKNSNIGENKELYVKTRSYLNLREQNTYFFLGRKGSGKSTLGPLLYLMEGEKYKDHLEINVDKLQLEYLMSIILDKPFKNDIGIVIPIPLFFKFAWEIFVFINCFKILVKEYKNNKLTKGQKKYIPVIKDFLNSIDDNEQNKFISLSQYKDYSEINSLFQWCVSSIYIHYENAIKNARNEEPYFHYDLNKALTREYILQNTFSDKVLLSFYSILRKCKRKFLISFDGFDSMFETFRIATNKYENDSDIKDIRKKLEVGFLEGFLDLTHDIKGNQYNEEFYKKISVCITVPKDRFFEIKNTQRDSYRYINKSHEIKWTGIELSIMLRKRLELLNDYKSDDRFIAEVRLTNVLERTIPDLPLETSISLDGKQYMRNTFHNILRHSFWRPREIIIYYSKLIAVIGDLRKRNITVDNFTVNKIISETTFDIINEEFIAEFRNYCLNLKAIINLFKDSNQILSYSDIEEKISTIHFELIDRIIKEFKDKIEFLFEIGFIGIEVSKKIMDSYRILICDIFCFNTSNKTFEFIQAADYDGCKFIIHPIFCEYLGLNTNKQDRLTIDINSEYLRKQDSFV